VADGSFGWRWLSTESAGVGEKRLWFSGLSRITSVRIYCHPSCLLVCTFVCVGALKMQDMKMQDMKLTDQNMQGMKLQDMKMTDQCAGHEIAGHEIDGPICKA